MICDIRQLSSGPVSEYDKSTLRSTPFGSTYLNNATGMFYVYYISENSTDILPQSISKIE